MVWRLCTRAKLRSYVSLHIKKLLSNNISPLTHKLWLVFRKKISTFAQYFIKNLESSKNLNASKTT